MNAQLTWNILGVVPGSRHEEKQVSHCLWGLRVFASEVLLTKRKENVVLQYIINVVHSKGFVWIRWRQ